MGAKLDIRIEWFKQFWMSMLPLSLKPSLTQGWEKMVFEGYQDGYNGSHIIYSNGTGIAFMNVHGVLDSYRFITFLQLTPGVSAFFLTTVSKGWFHVGKGQRLQNVVDGD